MTTKIKRCLYIGLGGTGMNALLYTKKMFVENYGEVPPMIGFLGIDTDGGAYKKQLETNTGKKISLGANEQLPIMVKNARPIYEVHKECFSWIPQESLYALSAMTLGAGQIRTNGRFAFTVNYQNILMKVQNVLNAITNAQNISNQQYELLGTEIEIHMVFSVCGGTGAGTFLNMASLLKYCAPECKLTGYAVLPGVFKAMSNHAMTKVLPNAYGSIMDLDYLMHLDVGKKSVILDYLKDSVEIKERPFNSVVFIDNKNVNNDTYTQIDELSEMLSLALVIAAGELSVSTASVSDNLEKEIREGNMDIENKRAWGAGLGVCELVYKGKRLGHVYAIKAAKLLIERLLNSCEDIDLLVNNWIDSPNVNIRENDGHDYVIDAIAEPHLKYDFTTINDYKDATGEAEAYLQLSTLKDDDLKKNCSDMLKRIEEQLHLLITQHINQECGISTAEKLILGINAQIDIFEGEMSQEKKVFQDQEPSLKSAMEIAISDLSEADHKFFITSGKKRDLADDVMAATKSLALCSLEIARRSNAIIFFNGVRGLLLKYLDRVKTIKGLVKKVYEQFTLDLAQYQNRVDTMYKTFEIDLAQNALKSLTVNPEEIQISEFVRTILEKDHILDFDRMNAADIANYLMQYTLSLPSSKKTCNTTIDEVVNNMSEDEFERVFSVAIKKATPLFRHNYRGHTPNQQVGDFFYIGIPDKNNSRLSEMEGIDKLIVGPTSVNYTSTGMHDRIVIYRQIGVVPAYTLEDLPIYRKEYEACSTFCNLDAILKTRMDREGFELEPKKVNDDDLLDLWVKGFIFNLIKNENNTYYFQSESEGDTLDDNWVELSHFRDEAFEAFKKYKRTVRVEFNNKIDQLIQKQGEDATQALIEEVKKDYLDNFSQIMMTKDQIRARGNEKIRELITNELDYIKSLRS